MLVIHAKSSRVYISYLENELMVAGAGMGEETVRESGIDMDTWKICYFNRREKNPCCERARCQVPNVFLSGSGET